MTTIYNDLDLRGQTKVAIAAKIPDLAPLPVEKKYGLIALDPPWKYGLRESDKTHRNRTPYPNMSNEEILALPIGAIAAPNSYILLWVTNNHMELGLQCLKQWGFDFKAIHTWVKTTKDRSKVNIGVGHYGRNSTEHFLVGMKGKPGSFTHLGLTNIPNVILAPRREHSRKPDEFYTLSDRLSQAMECDRIELFARERREGWDCWGLEA